MKVTGLIGTKIDQKQVFLENGTRIPVSLISIGENVVTQVKTQEVDGYSSLQVGLGSRKRAKKSIEGIAKKAGLKETPRFLREVKTTEVDGAEKGSVIKIEDVFQVGDIVNVAGTSKGKGYAGVMKRHGFGGGPRTHGQSDRMRAPGSIGASATPGRVLKGKRMAGRMGDERVTVKNLVVMDIQDGVLVVKGLIPGPRGELVEVNKVGESKKFTPIYKKVEELPAEEVKETAPVEETVVVEQSEEVVTPEAQAEESAPAEEEKVEEKTEEKEEAK